MDARMRGLARQWAREIKDARPLEMGPPPQKPEASFANMGEDEELGPDGPFREDDISSDGHRELEQHREDREYARLAAWEMPLLASEFFSFFFILAVLDMLA